MGICFFRMDPGLVVASPNLLNLLLMGDMTLMVRQLPTGSEGLPIEIYVFINDTRWEHYEASQADIFDHILAVVPEFGLSVFQRRTGEDFRWGDSARGH